MKILLDVKISDVLKENDLIVFDKKTNQWVTTHTDLFLRKITTENENLKKSIRDLKNEIQDFKQKVNQKLKEYHDVLNLLKGE